MFSLLDVPQNQFLDAQIFASILSNISSVKSGKKDDLVDVRSFNNFFLLLWLSLLICMLFGCWINAADELTII